jgi:hypothetical protein
MCFFDRTPPYVRVHAFRETPEEKGRERKKEKGGEKGRKREKLYLVIWRRVQHGPK